ncbi:MAG: hypothetical protein B6244_04760 [Candidatus Cloacimonetes bacterium 4572_55]|nr:MAG: hypothetical protein B6244_04760 [Candidatus Cloacimonetes bacterium 4572_55]
MGKKQTTSSVSKLDSNDARQDPENLLPDRDSDDFSDKNEVVDGSDIDGSGEEVPISDEEPPDLSEETEENIRRYPPSEELFEEAEDYADSLPDKFDPDDEIENRGDEFNEELFLFSKEKDESDPDIDPDMNEKNQTFEEGSWENGKKSHTEFTSELLVGSDAFSEDMFININTFADENQVVVFRLNDEKYGVNINVVKEIVKNQRIQSLPVSSAACVGVIHLRDHVIPVLNLKNYLGMKHHSWDQMRPIIILKMDFRMNGHTETELTAALVDEVIGAEMIHKSQIEDAPETVFQKAIIGVAKTEGGLISLIDPSLLMRNAPTDLIEGSMEESDKIVDRDTGSEQRQFIGFMICDDLFAVNIHQVQEIKKSAKITKVPRTPSFLEGVVNLRGQIVPVINLRERFGAPRVPYDASSRIIITILKRQQIGLIVDSVVRVFQIPTSEISEPPANARTEEARYIENLARFNDQLIVILNLKEALRSENE